MTRDELVKAIYDSCADWTCPDNHGCENIEDGSPAVLCMQCAEKLLKEYDDKIRADGYHKAESDYFAKTQKDREDAYNCGYEIGRADERSEWECAVADRIIKYSEDIYSAFPEVIAKIRADAIEMFLNAIKTYDTYGYEVDELGEGNYLVKLNSANEKDFVPYIHLDDVIKCAEGVLKEQKNG